jgi:hypothetical protein
MCRTTARILTSSPPPQLILSIFPSPLSLSRPTLSTTTIPHTQHQYLFSRQLSHSIFIRSTEVDHFFATSLFIKSVFAEVHAQAFNPALSHVLPAIYYLQHCSLLLLSNPFPSCIIDSSLMPVIHRRVSLRTLKPSSSNMRRRVTLSYPLSRISS